MQARILIYLAILWGFGLLSLIAGAYYREVYLTIIAGVVMGAALVLALQNYLLEASKRLLIILFVALGHFMVIHLTYMAEAKVHKLRQAHEAYLNSDEYLEEHILDDELPEQDHSIADNTIYRYYVWNGTSLIVLSLLLLGLKLVVKFKKRFFMYILLGNIPATCLLVFLINMHFHRFGYFQFDHTHHENLLWPMVCWQSIIGVLLIAGIDSRLQTKVANGT
jgi:hypothetical protein